MSGNSSLKSVPRAALSRLPKYLEYFKAQKRMGAEIIYAADICSEFMPEGADPLDDLACIGAEDLPTLTGPFCVATWLFLLPAYDFFQPKTNS